MFPRILLAVALLFSCASCTAFQKKSKDKKPAEKSMADVSSDVSFQAFLGRLRKAVAAHDVQTLAPMMTQNFGYRLEPPGEGEGVFQYWDEQGIWPELQSVLNERFAPKGNFMVAPPQFIANPDAYHGYRAGIGQFAGSWRFAYFVNE